MARKNSLVSTSLIGASDEPSGVKFEFPTIGREFEILIDQINDDIYRRAVIHGLTQKITDAAAGCPDASDKHHAMLAVRDRLIDGEWNKRTGEGGGSPAGVIWQAFREFTHARREKQGLPAVEDEKLREFFDSKSRAEQLALRKIPEIADIIERIKSEKGGASTIDVDELLSGLDDL